MVGMEYDDPYVAALDAAARDALRAPSIFNTQPWQWRHRDGALELWADWSRQLAVVDPDGHSLLVSCGAALHHARVSLAAAGWNAVVERTGERDRLARIRLAGRGSPDPAAELLREAIPIRRTDRRPFADKPVPPELLELLVDAAAQEGVRLHRVRLGQMPMLAIAVAMAAADELSNPGYRLELLRWTNRPEWSGDGVPVETAVTKVPRRVPVRQFALDPKAGVPINPGGDRGAAYLILHGEGTEPGDWLRAGEALSAVLLTAVSRGLAVAPITDVLEVAHPRELVTGLLNPPSTPYVLVRCGYQTDPTPLAPSPRRDSSEVIVPPEASDAPVAVGSEEPPE
jgi:hypothetical protein